ncbi:hypothetical protein ECANGB1_1448 [Enterospora canceri]|uniref:Uncharacterized protein n=1 Tax=Enterospora canceri TaxID=1081671 RepID=A0A1Y1S620_9MICR|nr:hypothetical protein ECANGB1_1448 [Enterospora canceri]
MIKNWSNSLFYACLMTSNKGEFVIDEDENIMSIEVIGHVHREVTSDLFQQRMGDKHILI